MGALNDSFYDVYFNIETTPWSPTNVTLAAWYDAADTNTFTLVSGLVSEWRDKSDNAKHLSQGTSTLRPTPFTRSLNGLNVLDFNVDSLNFPDAVLLNAPFSAFAVALTDTSTLFQYLYSRRNTGANGEMMLRNESGPTIQAYVFANGGGGNSSSITVGTPFISTVTMSGSVLNNFIDGGTPSTRSGISGYANIASGMQLGSYKAESYWNGTVAELIFVSSVVSDTDRQKIEGYLAWKWGLQGSLPSNHPYKNFAPTQ